MSLENQSIDNNILKRQKEEMIKHMTENLNKKLWEQQPTQTNAMQKLIQNIKKNH